jgi:hypothetical protein
MNDELSKMYEYADQFNSGKIPVPKGTDSITIAPYTNYVLIRGSEGKWSVVAKGGMVTKDERVVEYKLGYWL